MLLAKSNLQNSPLMEAIRKMPLMLIADPLLAKNDAAFFKTIEKACKYGIKMIQLREKTLPRSELLRTALSLRKITRKFNALFFINSYHKLAVQTFSDGIHFPEKQTIPKDASLTSSFILGKSIHSLDSAKDLKHVSYFILGNIFETVSKKDQKAKGLDFLEHVTSHLSKPVFAIGGISPENAKSCLNRGAAGVAVMSSIMQSKHLLETVKRFEKALC